MLHCKDIERKMSYCNEETGMDGSGVAVIRGPYIKLTTEEGKDVSRPQPAHHE